MPTGKVIPFQPDEYPELRDLPEGTKVSFDGEATIIKMENDNEENQEGEGSMGLQIDNIDLNPEGEATRELKKMTTNDSGAYAGANENKSGF